ncbi:MAG: glucokinase [Gemmatimonadetes bacterium]|nr:glucokinase [Gemmatimonadota bacterium]
MRVLAGDIGGTNARLAVVEIAPGGTARILHSARYSSQSYSGLAPIVRQFQAEVDVPVESAAFGIAGPVVEGEVKTSNIPWHISARALAEEIGIRRTVLLNDFEAVGNGAPWLGRENVATLQEGERVERGTIALIGAGTGLGEGFLVWQGGRYMVYPSEGGHVDFAARGELQWGLAKWIRAEYGNASYERVVSGPGLLNVYRYLAESGFAPERPEVRAEMESEDPAAIISRRALAGTDPLCAKTLDIFISVYGAQAGNLALTVLATGGVYLAGGIAPRILEKLRGGVFLESFSQKGRFSGLMAKVPVHVILSQEVGLIGAAAEALRVAALTLDNAS